MANLSSVVLLVPVGMCVECELFENAFYRTRVNSGKFLITVFDNLTHLFDLMTGHTSLYGSGFSLLHINTGFIHSITVCY